MIEEWIKDISRPVESKYARKDIGWSEWKLDHYPVWTDDSEYRFADEHKELEVVSSLLDYFAVKAMQSLMDRELYEAMNRGTPPECLNLEEIAKKAYDQAEVMLAERLKRLCD